MSNLDIKFTRLTPFKRCVLQNFPFIEADFDALTNYGLLCKIVEYLNQVIASQNEVQGVTEELVTAFNNLHDYVKNYFDNLDVQEEINNKLDEMADDGTLEEIINQEIFGDINARLNLLDNRKFVFVGDSYSVGWTPDGDVEGWPVKVKNYLGLSNSQVIYALHGGYGFHSPNAWFSTLIDECDPDDTVTDVVVCGGYNDINSTYELVTAGINAFKTSVANKFPNARIYVGFIGNSWFPSEKNDIFNCRNWYYENSATRSGKISYLNNVEYSLCSIYDSMASDGKHPNEQGQTYIAMNIANALLTGSADVTFRARGMSITLNDTIWSSASGLDTFSTRVTNGVTTIETDKSNASAITINSSSYNLSCNGNYVLVGTITNGHVIGNNFYNVSVPVHCIANYKINDGATNRYTQLDGNLLFEDKKVYIRFTKINDTGDNFLTLNDVRQIQIPMFSKSFQTLFC